MTSLIEQAAQRLEQLRQAGVVLPGDEQGVPAAGSPAIPSSGSTVYAFGNSFVRFHSSSSSASAPRMSTENRRFMYSRACSTSCRSP